MTFLGKSAGVNVPLLWTKGGDEFLVVGDHDYATFVLADSDCETTE
jgi:hypothetical protein